MYYIYYLIKISIEEGQSSIFDFNLIDCKQLANRKQLGMHLVALNGLMYIPLHEIHEKTCKYLKP